MILAHDLEVRQGVIPPAILLAGIQPAAPLESVPTLACPGLEKSLKLIEQWEFTHQVQLNRAANSVVRVPSSHGGSRWFKSNAAQYKSKNNKDLG
jgi:hypothetical protein